MQKVEHWRGQGSVPYPVKVAASAFLQSDPADPEVFECTAEEIEKLDDDGLIYQLLFDKKFQKWYFVGAGTYDRIKTNLYLFDETKNKMQIKRASIYFAEVDEAWIRNNKRRYEKDMAIPNGVEVNY